MKKFLIGVPVTPQTYYRCIGLLDLLCKTLPEKNLYADLFIYCRFDSDMPHPNLLKNLDRFFNKVWCIHAGPRFIQMLQNDNFAYPWLFKYVHSALNNPQMFPDILNYDALFILEKDSCPIDKDWLPKLYREYQETGSKTLGAWNHDNMIHGNITDCVGYIHQAAIYSMDLIRSVPELSDPLVSQPWDLHVAPFLLQNGWQGTYMMKNFHKAEKLDCKTLSEEHCVLVHGVADDSARNYFLKQHE